MEDLKKIQEFFSKPLEENVDKKYSDFLVALRDSGVTNMFGAAPYLQAEFGLDKREAREVLANWMRSFDESLKENSRKSPDFILTEPAEIKYTESFGTGIKAPGVLHHANAGAFLGAEGAYIIVLPGGTFYVDEDKEEAMPIWPLKDQDQALHMALDYTPFSPKYETWKSWIKRPNVLDEETVDEYNTGIYYDPAKEKDNTTSSKTPSQKIKDIVKKIMKSEGLIDYEKEEDVDYDKLYSNYPYKINENEDAVDVITMDIPLFIRILEYSREDAQEDMDLHELTEKAIEATKQQGILSMDDYDMLVGDLKQLTMEQVKDLKPSDMPKLKGRTISWRGHHAKVIDADEAVLKIQYLDGKKETTTINLKQLKDRGDIVKEMIAKIKEERPGLWANIHAKRERGEKPSHGNSKAHKSAVKAGKKINKAKK